MDLYANVIRQAVQFATLKATYLGAKSGILAIGLNGDPVLRGFQSWITASGVTEPITYITAVSGWARAETSEACVERWWMCVGGEAGAGSILQS
jgi:hypothetical protein